jgi:hypothetical protein
MFGDAGGGFALVGTEPALKLLAVPETRPGATGVAWYTTLREEIRKGASALFRDERREERESTVSDAVPCAEPEVLPERAREDAVPAPDAAAEAQPQPEPSAVESPQKPREETREEVVAAAEIPSVAPQFWRALRSWSRCRRGRGGAL